MDRFATQNATRKLCIINSSLQDQPTFQYDSAGKITGYKTKAGADTTFPFKVSEYEKEISRLIKQNLILL